MICLKLFLQFSLSILFHLSSYSFQMSSLLLYLHLSFIKSLLFSLKKFIEGLLCLLLCPVLLLLELIKRFFSKCSVLFSSQESWRHLSSLLYFFLLSMLIIFLLLFLKLSSLLSFLSDDLISRIAFESQTFCSIECFSLFLIKLLFLLSRLM